MNKKNEYLLKLLLKAALTLKLSIILTACGGGTIFDDLERLDNQYDSNRNKTELVALLPTLRSYGLISRDEIEIIKDIFFKAKQNEDYELFYIAAKLLIHFEIEAIHSQEIVDLSTSYDGDMPGMYELIGRWFFDNKKIKSAFINFEKAALLDYELSDNYDGIYATEVRSILRHYGCMQTDAVWSELSKNTEGSIEFIGGDYPPISKPEGFDEILPKLRVSLSLGIKPKLEEGCPINLYE